MQPSLNPRRERTLGSRTSALSPLNVSSSTATLPDSEYRRSFVASGGDPRAHQDDPKPKGFGNLNTADLWIPVGSSKQLSSTYASSFLGAIPPPPLPRAVPVFEPSTLNFHGTTTTNETLGSTAALAFDLARSHAAVSSSSSSSRIRSGGSGGSKVFSATNLPLQGETENRARFQKEALSEAAERTAVERARRVADKSKHRSSPTSSPSSPSAVAPPLMTTHNREAFGQGISPGRSAVPASFAPVSSSSPFAATIGQVGAKTKNVGVQTPGLASPARFVESQPPFSPLLTNSGLGGQEAGPAEAFSAGFNKKKGSNTLGSIGLTKNGKSNYQDLRGFQDPRRLMELLGMK